MRVALVALHFAEYTSRLALALAADHDVLLVLNAENARAELTDMLRMQLAKSVDLQQLELHRRSDPRVLGTSVTINRILKQFAPDVLHIQELHPLLGGWTQVSNRRRVPVVVTVHDPVFHSGEIANDNWRRHVVTWFRSKAHRLIVHGPNGQALLENHDADMAGRIDIVPHGVLGRADLDADPAGCEPRTFLFFGRIRAYKGLGYFLDAGEILHSRGHDFRLIVAGTGGDLERYRPRIESAAWVELLDRYIDPAELPGLIRRAAAVVLPYTDGTQSGVCAMAFAHARPVIATRVGDLPAVVIDGRTGLTVPPCDLVALAAAMETLLVDRPLRDTLAAGALQFARGNLSWPRIAALTCGVYGRAVRQQQLTRMQYESLR